MTTDEFSNEFDILANSYSDSIGNQLLKFDEYEKSIFLTQAQEQVVQSLYTGKLTGDSFEETEQLRRYLNDLVKTEETQRTADGNPLEDNSKLFQIKDDVLFITYEEILTSGEGCLDGKQIPVIPITQDEYHRVKRNPFRKANSRKALRLDSGIGTTTYTNSDGSTQTSGQTVEIITDYDIGLYRYRYIKRPDPIILIDLPDSLTINKISTKSECTLNPALHRTILELAVSQAVKSRVPSAGK